MPISGLIVGILCAVAGAVVALAVLWLYLASRTPNVVVTDPKDVASLALQRAQLRVDVVKNSLAVLAGGGGAVALFLAFRRQYWTERKDYDDRDRAERAHEFAIDTSRKNHEHQQRIAAQAEHDSTERRVTDLYTKAAEMLGSGKAAVRLAGLYALERLAQGNAEHRQTIVNVICAYLRMIDAEQEEASPEFEVRLAAQRVLVEHAYFPNDLTRALHAADDTVKHPRYWPGIYWNLRGAYLFRWNMNHCRVAYANFDGAIFFDYCAMTDCVFDKIAIFRDAKFHGGAYFNGTTFGGETSFARTEFAAEACFDGVRFRESLTLDGMVVRGDLSFDSALFVDEVAVRKSQFKGEVQFDDADFSKSVRFEDVNFGGRISFKGLRLKEPLVMDRCEVVHMTNDTGESVAHLLPAGWRIELDNQDKQVGRIVES